MNGWQVCLAFHLRKVLFEPRKYGDTLFVLGRDASALRWVGKRDLQIWNVVSQPIVTLFVNLVCLINNADLGSSDVTRSGLTHHLFLQTSLESIRKGDARVFPSILGEMQHEGLGGGRF